jgi:hypothetical protein
MREAFEHWILWRRYTLLSLSLRHVIKRGALVGSRASTPLKFLLSHTFRDTWRTCRALFRRYPLFPEMEEMLIEKVRQRNFLHDTKSSDYRDQRVRANARKGIGKELIIKSKFYVFTCMCDVRTVCSRPKENKRLCATTLRCDMTLRKNNEPPTCASNTNL